MERRLVLDSTTVFNEVMYHPADGGEMPEWIELHNQMSVNMDLSRWQLRGGVQYTFPSGTVIPAGGYLVVTESPSGLESVTGHAGALGPFSGNLANSGETIELVNLDDRVMDVLAFEDQQPWPVGPDGSGSSLAKLRRDAGTADPANWATSEQVGGTPGRVNFQDDDDSDPIRVTLVDPAESGRILVPDQASQGLDWTAAGFDDSNWVEGGQAVGFDTEEPEPVFGLKNVALNKPVVATSGEYVALAGFDAQNVTDGSDQDVFSTGVSGSSTYWLGRQGVPQEWLIVDLEAEYLIEELRIRNTHNTQYNDRGTGAFRVTVASQINGNQLVSPVELVSGNLTNVSGQTILTTDVFNEANGLTPTTARYVRFETLSANNPGNHIGLNELEVHAETVLNIDFVPPPIGYWPLDGDAEDYSGNLSHGNAVGGGFNEFVPAPLGSGQSYRLNGNAYVSIPLNVSESSYTASLWFQTNRTGSGLMAVVDDDLGVGGHDRHLYLDGGNIASRVWNDETIRSTGRNYADGQWHHVVHVFGGDVGGQRIYVDGQLVASGNRSFSDFDWQRKVNIGFSNDAASNYLVGQIDDVAIWDQALHESVIQELYAGKSPLALTGFGALIATDLRSTMHETSASAYVRSTFSANPGIYDQLTFTLRYDDGFVAYLNGVEVASDNAPPMPGWDSAAPAERADAEAVRPRVFDLTDRLDLLTEENNVLAIHGLNVTADDEDFLIVPRLTARVAPVVPFDRPVLINEVAAAGDTPFWLELYNHGAEELVLEGYVVAAREADVEYVLPDVTIEAGGHLLLSEAELGFDVAVNDRVFLFSPGKTTVLDGVAIREASQARFPDGRRWMYQDEATPDEVNLVPLRDEIVINEIMYHAQPTYADPDRGISYRADDEEWIELFNRSDVAVDLSGWRLSDAIEFEFPAGTTIGPGEYLVVAGDAAALSAAHPGIDVLGNFDGNLSNSNETIRLLDRRGNPADEVGYYDSGKWPVHADGGGSSLELRDPWADNDNGAAWSASDETERVSWQHFSYSGFVRSPVYDPPINFHEFVLGLLDQGEVLLDNLRVVENPSSIPNDLLQNGSFQGDTVGMPADKWRIVGTHEASRIVADPDDASNKVLHLVAEGRANYLANHAETTLAQNARVTNSREYEISFDARWVAGSPQLRTELYYNDLPKVTILPTPQISGTPGAANSTLVANVGPTYSGMNHSPVIPDPGESVTVAVRADDPDGVQTMTLWYAVSGVAWNSVPMTAGIDGAYRGTIPGQAAATVVQFYVQGQDTLGATSTFPAAGRDSRALVKFQDNAAQDGRRTNFRYVMTPADANRLHQRNNILSNHRLGATVVVDEQQVFYDVGARLRGSMFSRQNASGTGFNVRFHPDQKFRDVHESVTMKTPAKREILIKHLAVQAGVPGIYDDMIYLIKPAGSGNGVATMSMSRHGDVFLESQFEDGLDGTVFKMEGIRVMQLDSGAGPEDLKTYHPNIGWMSNFDLADLGDDKEQYRWSIQINRNRDKDDYDEIIAMMKTFSLSGAALQQQAERVLDVDQWMRTFALMSLGGIGDAYSQGNPHNLNFYVRPGDNKVLALPWDWDFTFNRSATSPLWGNKNISKLISLPVNRRLFHGHLHDMINTVFNADYMADWTQHYGDVAGESYAGHLTYIQQRGDYVLSQLPAQIPFEISTNSGADFTVDTDSVELRGTGWINVREIRLAGGEAPLEVTWLNDREWSVRLPLEFGENPISLQAYDFQDQPVGSVSITVTSTANEPRIAESLRLTELMYHPADPSPEELADGYDDADEFEFIELANTGATTLSLDGVRLAGGVDFTFANLSIAPGQRVVVLEDSLAFRARYGTGVFVAGQWSGGLSNDGEEIQLLGPLGEVIHRFTYDDSGSWPERADGDGSSLEIVDVNGDYDGSGNWRPSVLVGGTPGSAPVEPAMEVVINEVLTHTDPPQVDAVELYNTTGEPIDVGGWYLSDSGSDYRKFRIPAGTMIPANGYLVFDETDFNAGGGADPGDFAFDGAHGDAARLLIPGTDGQADRFGDGFAFGAAANGESFGRWPGGSGAPYPMSSTTLGAANSGPRVGPVVISEINYNPAPGDGMTAEELEFIEVFNPTDSAVNLTEWRIRGGADFDFAPQTTLGAGQAVVIVSFDPAGAEYVDLLAAFRRHYGIDASVSLVGPFSGRLDNGGERITLQRPDQPPLDEPDFVPRLLEDQVVYDDQDPWPTTADGAGDSLTRVDSTLWGMSAAGWTAAPPSPGTFEAGPLSVLSVAINGGFDDPSDRPQGAQPSSWIAQRSDVRGLVVVFSRPVTATIDDFQLTNLGVNAPADDDTPVVLRPDMLTIEGNVVTLDFATDDVISGVHRLDIADSVTDRDGGPLDGDGDGASGGDFRLTGNAQNGLYELTGDWNGDGGVSIFDFNTFAYWFGLSVPLAPAYVDLSDDAGVSIFDFTFFAENFGRGIVDPAPLRDASVASEPETEGTAVSRKLAPVPSLGRPDDRGDEVRSLDLSPAIQDVALLEVLTRWNAPARGGALLMPADPDRSDADTDVESDDAIGPALKEILLDW